MLLQHRLLLPQRLGLLLLYGSEVTLRLNITMRRCYSLLLIPLRRDYRLRVLSLRVGSLVNLIAAAERRLDTKKDVG